MKKQRFDSPTDLNITEKEKAMDAKTLTEDAERYQDKIRELSLAKLSEPIRVLDEEGGREFNVTSYYDLYWLSPGTLLYVNDGYFMRSGLNSWVSTEFDTPISSGKFFILLAAYVADDIPIRCLYSSDFSGRGR